MSKPRASQRTDEQQAIHAARRKRRKEAAAAGIAMMSRAKQSGQYDHASNPRGRKKAAEGERKLRPSRVESQ